MSWTVQPLPVTGPLFNGAVRVYGDAFAAPPYLDPDRGAEVRDRMRTTHCKRRGFRALVAVEGTDTVIGMTYGYHGEPGQFWHDTVARKIGKEGEGAWLADSYELVELAVAPGWQSRGVGTALIVQLTDGLAEATCVLSTRTDSRAHNLYRRVGFEVIVEMTFAPGGEPFYVMGKKLR
jgi:ribosomal protein S18 acetylase RimI-like enzyme